MGLYPLREENARRTDARHHPLTNFDQYYGQVEDLVLLIITFLISFWDRECRITLTMRWHTAACHKLSTLPPVPPRVPPWLCPMRGLGEYSFRKFFFCYLTTGKILLKTLSKTFGKTQFDRKKLFLSLFLNEIGKNIHSPTLEVEHGAGVHGPGQAACPVRKHCQEVSRRDSGTTDQVCIMFFMYQQKNPPQPHHESDWSNGPADFFGAISYTANAILWLD